MDFGKRLYQMRKERQLTLRGLADEAGIDHSLLSKIEHGIRPDPEADLLFAVLNVMHRVKPVTEQEVEELLAEAQRMTPDRLERLRDSVKSEPFRIFMRRKPR